MVLKGLLEFEAKKIYKKYFLHKNIKKPYVVAKIACSNDNFTSSKSKIITNKYSRTVSHVLRYRYDSILTTSKTSNSDNSKLSCRINGLENYSPKRLIIDKNLKINNKSPIINDNNKLRTIIFHCSKDKRKIKNLKSKGIKLNYTELDNHNNINLEKVFSKAYYYGIGSILIEGGKSLTKSLIRDKLVNEFYLFKSNKNLGKLGKNNIFDLKKKISSFLKKKEKIETFLDGDEITRYY